MAQTEQHGVGHAGTLWKPRTEGACNPREGHVLWSVGATEALTLGIIDSKFWMVTSIMMDLQVWRWVERRSVFAILFPQVSVSSLCL